MHTAHILGQLKESSNIVLDNFVDILKKTHKQILHSFRDTIKIDAINTA